MVDVNTFDTGIIELAGFTGLAVCIAAFLVWELRKLYKHRERMAKFNEDYWRTRYDMVEAGSIALEEQIRSYRSRINGHKGYQASLLMEKEALSDRINAALEIGDTGSSGKTAKSMCTLLKGGYGEVE